MDLRPTRLKDIVGQENIKECIEILIRSRRNSTFPHCLFLGSTGLGKTTFATTIANELNKKIYLANGGNISDSSDVLPYLARLKRGDIFFIDEIHRVNKRVQEQLFTVMEDFRYDLAKNAYSVKLEPFTMLGATTESGMLLRPFYDRFEHQFFLEDYNINEISLIIRKNCEKLKVSASDSAIDGMAKRSRFTPRIANSILSFCRDFACDSLSSGRISISRDIVESAMKLKKIDEQGIDNFDKKYIMVLKRASKPLGLNTLVGMTGFSKETIENQIEPYLLKLGIIDKTQKGRQLI